MHSQYSPPSTAPQAENSPPMQTAWEAVAAGFADSLGPLTIYESAQLIDAPWGDGEIEPTEFDDWYLEDYAEPDYSQMSFQEQYGMTREEFFVLLEMERAKVAAAATETNVVYLPPPPPRPIAVQPYFKKPIPTQLRWAVFRRDGYRCVECGCDEDLTADHILAERNGGKATIGNLQTLCRPCNSRKGAR